jgi:hypothetical protein
MKVVDILLSLYSWFYVTEGGTFGFGRYIPLLKKIAKKSMSHLCTYIIYESYDPSVLSFLGKMK